MADDKTPFSMTLTLDQYDFGALITAITTTLEDSRAKIAALQGKSDTASVESILNCESLNAALAKLYTKLWDTFRGMLQ